MPGQPRWFGGHGSVCVGGGRPWPPHPLQESARHRPRLRLPSAGAGCVLPPDATHKRHTRRTLSMRPPLTLPPRSFTPPVPGRWWGQTGRLWRRGSPPLTFAWCMASWPFSSRTLSCSLCSRRRSAASNPRPTARSDEPLQTARQRRTAPWIRHMTLRCKRCMMRSRWTSSRQR